MMTTLQKATQASIIQDIDGVPQAIGAVAMSSELAAALAEGKLIVAPSRLREDEDGNIRVDAFGVFARDAAAPEPMPVERDGTNRMFTLDDLPLDEVQKMLVLEWFARKLWVMLEEGSGHPDYHGKSYDPLVIDMEAKEAHSYVFNLGWGGRHHPFTDLLDLEEKLKQEGIEKIKSIHKG